MMISTLINCQVVYSQNEKKIESGWGNLNYAVPESPAFKILDANPSNIMRPTATRDIAIAIGNYYLKSGASLPNNLAVEISPSLFNPKVNLKDYKKNRIWYTGTLSLGTKVNQDGSYAVSTGLKFKIIDKADLRLNPELNQFIRKIGVTINSDFTDALDEIGTEEAALGIVGVREAYSDSLNHDHKRIKKAVEKRLNDKFTEKVNLRAVSDFREKMKGKLWNAQIWDLGLAGLFTSKDSLVENLNGPNKLGLWSTYGQPLFKEKGQLLIGLNSRLIEDKLKKLKDLEVSIGVRLYYGSNNLKGYLEYENYFKSATSNVRKGSLGLETTISSGIWLSFSLGFSQTGDAKALFTPAFNLSFAQPERK